MKLVFAIAVMALGAVASQEKKVGSSKLDANGASRAPSISDDGDIIVFESTASNLVGGDNDSTWDVFVHSRKQHKTWCVSGADDIPARRPTVSGDGRWIAYLRMREGESSPGRAAWPKWSIALCDLKDGSSRTVDATSPRWSAEYPPRAPSLSRDGRWLVYVGKQDRADGVSLAYVFDRASGETELASVGTGGEIPDRDVVEPWISSNGRFVLFCTEAVRFTASMPLPASRDAFEFVNRQHVFVRDREQRTTRYASDLALKELGYADYHDPRVSDNGRFVAYNHHDSRWGYAPHVGFVSDLSKQLGGRLLRQAASQERSQGELSVTWMSSDGRRVLVESDIRDLAPIPGGVAGVQIYERDLDHETWTLLSRTPSGAAGKGESRGGVASSDMNIVAFWSDASNLVEGDGNRTSDVFVLDKSSGRIERISVAAAK